MDCLSELLGSFGASATLFSNTRFGTPWSAHTDALPFCVFHVIVDGEAFVCVDDEPEVHAVGPGDIVLFPRGTGHTLSSDPKLVPTPASSIAKVYPDCSIDQVDYPGRRGGDGRASCSILCGIVHFIGGLEHPLGRLLPTMIHMRRADTIVSWLTTMVNMLAAESERETAGSAVMSAKLAEMLFVQVIRDYIAQLDQSMEPIGWIAGFADPRIARCLALIHTQPTERWTINSLAVRVGMSRSSLFGRFSELVGVPPMQYLTEWRMHLAKLELRDDNRAMGEIAGRVGYANEGAFSKAFKRTVGVSPSDYRMTVIAAAG